MRLRVSDDRKTSGKAHLSKGRIQAEYVVEIVQRGRVFAKREIYRGSLVVVDVGVRVEL
jgi:hypothetical protein